MDGCKERIIYGVNNVSDFNRDVVEAFMNQDKATLVQLREQFPKTDYDVFICISKSKEAFILCAANRDLSEDPMLPVHVEHSPKPEEIPAVLLVSKMQLVIDKSDQHLYMIHWKYPQFRDIKDDIRTSFFIGHLKDLAVVDFQCAALDASPKVIGIICNDGVRFAKDFCRELAKYASNSVCKENQFLTNIKALTELTGKTLSDQNESYLYQIRNIFERMDFTGFLFSAKGIILVVIIMLVYPIAINMFIF